MSQQDALPGMLSPEAQAILVKARELLNLRRERAELGKRCKDAGAILSEKMKAAGLRTVSVGELVVTIEESEKVTVREADGEEA